MISTKEQENFGAEESNMDAMERLKRSHSVDTQINAIAHGKSLPGVVANGKSLASIDNPTYQDRIMHAETVFGKNSEELSTLRGLLKDHSLKESAKEMVEHQNRIKQALTGVDTAIVALVQQVLSSHEYMEVITSDMEEPVLSALSKVAKKYRNVDLLDLGEEEIVKNFKKVMADNLEKTA